MLRLKQRWGSQPQIGTKVAPEWRSRVRALFDGRGFEVTTGSRPTTNTTPLQLSRLGYVGDWSGSTNQQYAHQSNYVPRGPWSLIVLAEYDSLSNYSQIYSKVTSIGAPRNGVDIRVGQDTNNSRINVIAADSVGYGERALFGSSIFSATGKPLSLILTFDGFTYSPGGTAYVDGVPVGTYSNADGTPATDAGATAWIGRRYDGATQLDGRIYYLAIVDGQLNAAEASRIYREKWTLHAPRPIWVPVSTANAYTLTAGQGSYTSTGQSAGLIAARTISAAQGSYALTGQDAGLYFGHLLTAAQGSYSLSAGQSVSLLAARLLGAAQGSYSLTGQDAALTTARLLAAGQGSYTLSGQDVTLTYTPAGSYSLTASAGTYGLTGQSAGLIVSRLLGAAQGLYSLTGQSVTLTYGSGTNYTITADYGAYSLTGQAAALSRTFVMTADGGTYVLTGRAATLSYSVQRYSAPPLGHGPAMSQRTPAAGGRRAPNLSTRRR